MPKEEEVLSRTQERRAHANVRARLQKCTATDEMLCQLLYFDGAMAMKYTSPSRSMLDLMLDQEQDDYRHMLQEERRTIRRLAKRKLLNLEKQGADLEAVLTENGWEAVLRQRILSCQDVLPNEEHCIVAFDIPQHMRTQRQLFRNFLKMAGFQCLQMSVWYTELDVVEDLLLLIQKAHYPFKIEVFRSKLLFSSQNCSPGNKSG